MLRRRFGLARRFSFRRGVAAVVVMTFGSVGLLSGCSRIPPVSMAATGDSIARGFDACGLLTDCPTISYATGSDPSSVSLYRRLLAASPQLAGHEYNDAVVGAHASDLFGQMLAAVSQRADVVTVLIGANDACAPTVGAMTPLSSFQASVKSAFDLFFTNRPGARLVLSSIPDLYRVWQVAHTDPQARFIWQLAGLCPDMLANPTSTATADTLRRVLVSLQIGKYNQALATLCQQYRGCKWDGGAVGRYQFTLSELSPYDFFHPNPAGQRALAVLAWKAYGG